MAQKKRQPRRELVDVDPGVLARLQVLDAVGEGVGQLQVGRRPGLLDVVAGDRDRVEARHLVRGEREDVADDLHRGLGRIDVGVPHHELFEDVVLDRPGELIRRDPLLLGRDDVERQHRQHGAVHRHRDAHLVQRDAVEELPHVQDRVDRDARHADVAGHPRVVGVVAAVGGQVEGDRQALLPGGEVAPVERVGLRRGGEARVLPDRPRLGRVHRRVGPAQVRRDARIGVQEVQPGEVRRGEQRRDGDALGRLPGRVRDAAAGRLLEGLGPVVASARRRPGRPSSTEPKSGIALMPALLRGPARGARCAARRARRSRRTRTRRRRRPRAPACRRATPGWRRPPCSSLASPAADSA